MKPFSTVLLFIASRFLSTYLLPSFSSFAYWLLSGVFWILFVIVMSAR